MTDRATKELRGRVLWLTLGSIAIVGLLAFGITNWFLSTQSSLIIVRGESMEPTLHNGEFFFLAQNSEPEIGDIVVFPRPRNWESEDESNLVKRIAALPGDRIVFNGKQLLVNDDVAYDLSANSYMCSNSSRIDYSHTLDKNEVFVMGDNHKASIDSLFMFCEANSNENWFVPLDSLIAFGSKKGSFPW